MDISNPISSIVDLGKDLLDKFVPDPQQRAQAQLQMAQLEAQILKGQTDVNTAEASNESIFVSGWRPFIGWICGFAFGFKYIGGPFIYMIAEWIGHPITLPNIDSNDLVPILLGMLGLGVMRTVEKTVNK